MANDFNCKVMKLAIQYLGPPSEANPRSKALWNLVVENFEKRLSMWKRQGRVTLIKANLSDLMFYYICNISLFKMPAAVEANSDRIRRNFLSDGKSDRKKTCLMR